MKFNVRNRFSERVSVVVDVGSESATQQHFAADCDIHNILRNHALGLSDIVNRQQPSYMDVSDLGDFRDMQNRVLEFNQQFENLPADLRRKFDDNPQILADFLLDPANLDQAVELGLLNRETIPTPPIDPIDQAAGGQSPAGAPSNEGGAG